MGHVRHACTGSFSSIIWPCLMTIDVHHATTFYLSGYLELLAAWMLLCLVIRTLLAHMKDETMINCFRVCPVQAFK